MFADRSLLFADREVTLAELSTALSPSPRRLAVLSACRTNGRADLESLLPDAEPPVHSYADPRFWAAFACTGV